MLQELKVQDLYDRLADKYQLIAGTESLDETFRRQGSYIRRILEDELNITPPAKIRDCSCGIGTQALGLAMEGYEVTGSDLSPKAIERANYEAKRLNLNVDFSIADFLELATSDAGKFDVILSWENSITCIPDNTGLLRLFQGMRSQLKRGGRILVSTRDYEQLSKETLPGTPPVLIQDEHGENVYFQLWNWSSDKKSYQMRIFLMHSKGDACVKEQQWVTQTYTSRVRAFVKSEIEAELERAGFDDVRWYRPETTTYGMLAFSARYIDVE